jgi:polo-like kinase 1
VRKLEPIETEED